MKIDPQIKEDLKKYLQNELTAQKQHVTIIAPYELGEKELSILKDRIPQLRNAQIEQQIDTNILAGVVVKFGSKMIDLSLQGELQKLQQSMYEIA